jgi:hypothetical protein
MYYEVQILVCNNHEFDVGMNCNIFFRVFFNVL